MYIVSMIFLITLNTFFFLVVFFLLFLILNNPMIKRYINIDRRKGAIVNKQPLDKTDFNVEKIESMLDLLVAQSYLLGMSREEFLDYSNKLFDKYEVKDYE